MAVAALPDPAPDETVLIDAESLTLAELEEIEDITGRNVVGELGRGQPSARTMTALVFIFKRRDNPQFTLEDARALRVTAFRTAEPDPKDNAG